MELTSREFWSGYWRNKSDEFKLPIQSEYLFTPLFRKEIENMKPSNAVELGGFPGTFSIYLNKYFQLPTTLVDYFIDDELLHQFMEANDLKSGDLTWKEADILTEGLLHDTYDFVFSIGLIEHFEDTTQILRSHVKYVRIGGSLLIVLPNFRGINGWFQRNFDIENYNKHYIQCMDPQLLKQELKNLGCTNIEAGYFAKFSIWLENYKLQPVWAKALFKATWTMGKILSKIVPMDSKLFSPYIQIRAELPA